MKATHKLNLIAVALALTNAHAQQFPIPQTAAEVPGPATGTAMTKAYVQTVGRMAYLWGWPLVNVANRADAFSKAPEPGLLGGVVPVAFNRNAMLTGYISPDEHFVTCPNRPAGNGWNSPVNNAQWGTDYLNRTATAKSNMYDNRPEETKYIYRDDDSQGKQLDGHNLYTVTFAKGQLPPVKGFWSVTLYNDVHLFNPNPLKRYSLGTKNKTLKYNADGSLTLYAGAKSPGKDKESNWLPAPAGTFSLYIRCYWSEQAVLDGTWMPPQVEKVK
jgi:hypothetical protein